MPGDFLIGFQKDLLFPEWGNNTISIRNTTRRFHLPQPNFLKYFQKRGKMSVKQTGIWFILDYIDSSISSQRL